MNYISRIKGIGGSDARCRDIEGSLGPAVRMAH